MINPKEELKSKFQKEKLFKNKNLRKAEKYAANDYRLDLIKSDLLNQNQSEEEIQKLKNKLKITTKEVVYDHYKDIANRIKYKKDIPLKKPENIQDYDFPIN